MLKNFFKIVFFTFMIFSFSCATTKKKDENFLGDFNSISLGKIMGATVSRTKNELSPREISFVFEPRNNMFSFHHKYMGDNIWITMDYQNRQDMIVALDKYLATYKTGELNAQNNKKKAYFGQTNIKMAWGLLGVTHAGRPDIRFEYQLFGQKNLPYFIVASKTKKASGNDEANSPAIRIALSPAKCLEFRERLEQENLLKLVEELQTEFEKFEPSDFEDYQNENVKADIEKSSTEPNESLDIDESDFEF